MQIEGELCAPYRDGETGAVGAPVAPASIATSTPSEYGKIANVHSDPLSWSFASEVKPGFGGFSSPVMDMIISIASQWQIRGFKAGWNLIPIRGP